jgi:hypothetical protein
MRRLYFTHKGRTYELVARGASPTLVRALTLVQQMVLTADEPPCGGCVEVEGCTVTIRYY